MGSDGCAHECFDTYNEMQNADTLYTVLLLTRDTHIHHSLETMSRMSGEP